MRAAYTALLGVLLQGYKSIFLAQNNAFWGRFCPCYGHSRAFTALQGGKMAVGEGIGGIIRSYNGIAWQGGQQPERSDPGAGGLRGQLALCVISLYKF